MSLPDRAATLLVRLVCAGLATLALTGCFQPMYATSNTQAGPGLENQLRDIEIVKIEGRLGNELRNTLIFDLTGGTGNPAGAPYQLFIVVKSTSTYAIADTASGLPEAKIVRVEGNWRLMRANETDKPPVAVGQAAASASIDVSVARFANYSAMREAEQRASVTLAEMIKTQLIAHFVRQKGS